MSEANVATKWCWSCKTTQPVGNFFRNRSRDDGLTDRCKQCDYARLRKYAKTTKGKAKLLARVKQYQATAAGRSKVAAWQTSERGRLLTRSKAKRASLNHPEKIKARNDVSHAVTRGEMPKAATLRCRRCGKQAESYHHHLGYTPEHRLHVIPLCNPCHRLEDRQQGIAVGG